MPKMIQVKATKDIKELGLAAGAIAAIEKTPAVEKLIEAGALVLHPASPRGIDGVIRSL